MPGPQTQHKGVVYGDDEHDPKPNRQPELDPPARRRPQHTGLLTYEEERRRRIFFFFFLLTYLARECHEVTLPPARFQAGTIARMSGDAEAWLAKLKLCISETVAMRHPRPMEHIAKMLVEPSFEESLGLPTAEYVRRHDLEQRITNALGSAGFKAGQSVPADMLSRLSAQLLADAKPQPDAGAPPSPAVHSQVVQAAVQAAKAMLESAPLPSEGETGAEQDSSSAWSCRTFSRSTRPG